MKKNGVLKLLVLGIMVVVIMGVEKSSFAVSTITPIENSTGNGTNNTMNNISTNNTSTNEPVNNTPVNNVVQNTPVNNTVLPDTGAKSSVGLFVIMGIFGASAVYTFVKIKKYEI